MSTPERDELLRRLAALPGRAADLAVAARARRRAGRAGRPGPDGAPPTEGAPRPMGAPRPTGWSERQILAHLAAVETVVFQARLDQLAAEVDPHWRWTEPGGEPGHASLAALGARLARRRRATIRMLRALDDAGWARSGTHATYGRLDVAGLIGIMLDHDEEHLAELARRGLTRGPGGAAGDSPADRPARSISCSS